jgi:trimethylamine---corrinoid protein Co-methyltransferase
MIVDEVAGEQLHLSILTAEDLDAIRQASLEILERTGMFVELPQALEMLRGAGATVEGNRVRIPSYLIDAALRTVPHRIVIADRDGRRRLSLEGNRSYFRGSCDNARILDPYTGSLRAFKTDDYRMTAKIVDACPGLHAGGCAGNARDYPAEIRAQAGFKYSMLNMRKPFVAAPLDIQQMGDIYDMAAVIAGDHDRLRQAPFVIATCEPTTPLGIFKDAAEILLLAADRNMPVVWYGMPAAGSTAPSTPAGVLALGNAEVLAGLVLHQLARPGAPFIYGMMPSAMDMRSTQWAYGSPDFALMLAAATDLGHSYGLPIYGTAGCSDATRVDVQAAAEGTLLCLMGQLSGANLIHDVGLMAGNQFISPEMMVLCDELLQMVDHATRPIDTSREELAVDLIDQVGPQGNYLALDHTLANCRRFWHSGIFLRNRLTGSEEDEPEPVAERINRKTREIIETHEVEPLPDEVIHELDDLEAKWTGRLESN